MIVALDTNVIVSSLLSSRGATAEIFRRWEAEAFEVVTSPALLGELARALTYEQVKRYIKQPQKQIDSFVKRFGAATILVEPQQAIDVLRDDPDDNHVLECAVEGGASYIIAGDTHLLDLGESKGIIILTPRGFLSVLTLEGVESAQ